MDQERCRHDLANRRLSVWENERMSVLWWEYRSCLYGFAITRSGELSDVKRCVLLPSKFEILVNQKVVCLLVCFRDFQKSYVCFVLIICFFISCLVIDYVVIHRVRCDFVLIICFFIQQFCEEWHYFNGDLMSHSNVVWLIKSMLISLKFLYDILHVISCSIVHHRWDSGMACIVLYKIQIFLLVL